VRRDFINGMGKVGGRFVIILEADKALDVDEMSQLCDAAQDAVAAEAPCRRCTTTPSAASPG
jgi:purine-binding chemotaxis protein CheW